jgi:hypothetical protein
MKSLIGTAVTILALTWTAAAQNKLADTKIRVFVDANSSTEFSGDASTHRGLFGGIHTKVAGTQYDHSQIPEVIKTLNERCPTVTVTMDRERAFFLISVEHESSAVKGLARRRNHVTVINREGDVVFSKNDRELGNVIKDACPVMALTPEQIASYNAEITTAAAHTAEASQKPTTKQVAAPRAQNSSQEVMDMTPHEESLGDIARRLKAEKAASKEGKENE